MIIGHRQQRLEKAISYLVSIKMMDGTDIVKEISEKVDRHPSNVRSALRGEDKYLTYKFVKAFCMIFGSVISPEWIWEGTGEMVQNKEPVTVPDKLITEEELMNLTKNELISFVRQLMTLHNEQTEMYRLLIQQHEQMIRNGQERFNNITNIIFKNV